MDEMQERVGRNLYTPQEASFYGVELIRAIQQGESRSLIFPIEGMQNYVAPLMPWETMVIIAQTSQYKSGTLDFWEHEAAKQLALQNRKSEAILHISLEETVEAMAFRGFARLGKEDAGRLARGAVQDWGALIDVSTKFSDIPIYRIGRSTINRNAAGVELHLSNIQKAIDLLVNGEITGEPVRLGGIFLDYLQALPMDPEMLKGKVEVQRRLQVFADVYRLQDWPVRYNCPVVYAAQAKQHLSADKVDWKLPSFDDAEESNVVAQRPDRIITQWLPKQTSPLDTIIKHGSIQFTVEENLMLMRVAKQRGGLPAGKIFANRIDYLNGIITTDLDFFARNKGPNGKNPYTGQPIYGQE